MNEWLQNPLRWALCLPLVVVGVAMGDGQEAARPVHVVIKDGKLLAAQLPIDPTPRITAKYSAGMYFGLIVGGTRITCTPEMSVMPLARIDNQVVQPGFNPQTAQAAPQEPLPPGPFGKKRLGTQTKWTSNGLNFTQQIEVVPSRYSGPGVADAKRRLDTVRVTCLIENKDIRAHTAEWRVFIDTMIAENDGALFASPSTAPGEILDGVALQDRTLPEYLQVLERPNLKDPGFVATMTLKFGGKLEGPNRIVLCNTRALSGEWDVPVEKAGGDSACVMFWPAKSLKPGEKRTLVWAYGGGMASDTGHEDNVAVSLSGSFEPGKLFTILATVDDPAPGQALTLELPAGMQRIEGREREPVPAPQAAGTSAVLWKARVMQLGDFEVKVRSSTGVTHVKNIRIQSAP